MPAPIVTGVINFLAAANLGVAVFDGEIPRYGTDGQPITSNSPAPDWPAVKVYTTEQGFTREHTFEDPYCDEGPLIVKVWTTSRAQLEDEVIGLLGVIERLLASATNWQAVNVANVGDGNNSNPAYAISFLLQNWVSVQEEAVRTADSELLYRGELHYQVRIHGAVATQ